MTTAETDNTESNAATDESAVANQMARRKTWQRRLMAVGLGLLPFVFLETGLRLFGVGAEATDLHAGFGDVTPLFELDSDTGQ